MAEFARAVTRPLTHSLTRGVAPAAPSKGGGADYLAEWIGASVYADWKAKPPGEKFVASDETTPAVASGDKVGSWRSLVGGYTALNASPSQRLNLLIAGNRYSLTGDGADDSLLTSYKAGGGGNTVFFDIDVPASGSAGLIFGLTASSGRFFVGVDLLTGKLIGGIGSHSSSTIAGTTDFRGQRCVGAITENGSTVSVFSTAKPTAEYSAAQAGVPDTTIDCRIAAVNQAGNSPLLFWSRGIARIIAVRKGGLTLSDWQNISPQLAAAGA